MWRHRDGSFVGGVKNLVSKTWMRKDSVKPTEISLTVANGRLYVIGGAGATKMMVRKHVEPSSYAR